ncbi:hypothetical protein ACFV1L_30325 [Kitasatospora sp. NPDC059646]|uniref:hypothetical protein n=1 Tax=Kitasatospora sp. NPDC059646 TaxID=3346893 RepID=UPI003675DB75
MAGILPAFPDSTSPPDGVVDDPVALFAKGMCPRNEGETGEGTLRLKWGFTLPDTGIENHIQGWTAAGPVTVVTHSGNDSFGASYFIGISDNGEVVSLTRAPGIQGGPSHIGGCQGAGKYLAIACEKPDGGPGSYIYFYDMGNPSRPTRLPTRIYRPDRTAGAVAMTVCNTPAGLRHAIAVLEWHSVDFYYADPDLGSSDCEFSLWQENSGALYLGDTHPVEVQNIGLISRAGRRDPWLCAFSCTGPLDQYSDELLLFSAPDGRMSRLECSTNFRFSTSWAWGVHFRWGANLMASKSEAVTWATAREFESNGDLKICLDVSSPGCRG